jgi:gluconolactonase
VSQASILPDLPASPSPFVAYDPEFEAVLGSTPRLAHVADAAAHEGPVYVAADHALYFTTLPRPGIEAPIVDIQRLSLESGELSVVRPNAGAANGMALGGDAQLVVCEQLDGAITLVDPSSGVSTRLVDGFNSPNDVVVKSDGTIWFTDPSYGWLQGFRPKPQLADAVRRYDPCTGEASVVASFFDKPNGLCFSPDESVLYVTDTGANHEPGSFEPSRPHHIKAFDVLHDGRLAGERIFADVEPGFPDGIKVDADGRVYASSFSGVQVFNPSGRLIGEIELPGAVNFCFGGRDGNVLFITADTAIHAAHLQAKGP